MFADDTPFKETTAFVVERHINFKTEITKTRLVIENGGKRLTEPVRNVAEQKVVLPTDLLRVT